MAANAALEFYCENKIVSELHSYWNELQILKSVKQSAQDNI